MQNQIVEVLRELRIPMGCLGFKYLEKAISMTLEDENAINNMTKLGGIYAEVSRQFGTTPSRTERAMRHAIETSLKKSDKDTLMKYFGYACDHITNKDFLANMVYAVRKELGND